MVGLSHVFSVCTRGALLLAAFLVPITVLPWASEPLEIHKQTIVVILAIVAALSWLGYAITRQELTLQKRALFSLPILFVGAGLLSPGLLDSPYLSIVGQSGQEYTSLLSLSVFALLMLLVAHQGNDHRLQRQWFSAILLSSGIVALYAGAAMFGLGGESGVLTLVGTPNSCAIYLLATTALGCALWLTSKDEGDADVLPRGILAIAVRGSIIVAALVLLLMLLVIDYSALWLLTLITMGSMMAFALVRANDFPHIGRFLLPVGLFVAALVFIFLPSPFANPFPAEVGMSTSGTWSIVQGVFSSGGVLFGNGAGTFGFAYSQYHDPAIASSNFWEVTFDRGSSHMLTVIATFGIAGALLYGVFMLGTGWIVLSKLAREKKHYEWKFTFAPAIAWIAITSAQFLYPSNFTLSFLFWLLSGIILSQAAVASWHWNFARSPRVALVSAFISVIVLVGLVTTVFMTGSRYAADIAFARAQAIDSRGGDINEIITTLDRAALTNRWSDTYYRNLGQALLLKTAEVIQDEAADPAYIKELISASINAALQATSLSRANAMNWNAQGDVYREVGPLVSGADDFAIAAYQEALVRAPMNPKYYVALARAYLVKADKALIAAQGEDAALAAAAKIDRDQALSSAYTQLELAVSIRQQYAPAHFYLAYVLERQGKVTDAIGSMELVKASHPYDVGVALQLGLLYLKQGKSPQAKAEFERALEIVPNYANAHWYLASIYEEDKDFTSAIKEIEIILESNPDNTLVQQRLQKLKDGFAASQIPEPLEETGEALAEDATIVE